MRRRVVRHAGQAIVLGLILSGRVSGQSTEGLERRERPVVFEVGGGPQLLTFGWESARVGRVLAGMVAARWRPVGGRAGLRAAGWWIERREANSSPYDIRCCAKATHQILGLTISGDVQARVGAHATLAPSLGFGWSPRVHSTHSVRSAFEDHNEAISTRGNLWTLGLALRFRRVVIEQHMVGLLGGDSEQAIPSSREYFPMTLSVRF